MKFVVLALWAGPVFGMTDFGRKLNALSLVLGSEETADFRKFTALAAVSELGMMDSGIKLNPPVLGSGDDVGGGVVAAGKFVGRELAFCAGIGTYEIGISGLPADLPHF